MTKSTRCSIIACLAVLGTLIVSPGRADARLTGPVAYCPAISQVDGIGPSCLDPATQMYKVFSPAGKVLGFTHGGDAASPTDDLPLQSAAAAPSCVDATTAYRVEVIWAKASDDPDSFTEAKKSQIRSGIGLGLDQFDTSARATGSASGSVKILCDGSGAIAVSTQVLPTPNASSNISTISSDLETKGFANPQVKYWVLFDSTAACACAGIAMLYPDDDPEITNTNNGNAPTPQFAINFDRATSGRIWMHEGGHTLGAVQPNSPHSTEGMHCFDGRDTMCYNDGSARSNLYSTGYCATEAFDCRNDDYFNVQPEVGNYLLDHWNLASPNNRYLALSGIGTPEVLDPVPGLAYVGCTFKNPGPATGGALSAFVTSGCVRVRAPGAAFVRAFHKGRYVMNQSGSRPGDIYEDSFSTLSSERGLQTLYVVVRYPNGLISRTTLQVLFV